MDDETTTLTQEQAPDSPPAAAAVPVVVIPPGGTILAPANGRPSGKQRVVRLTELRGSKASPFDSRGFTRIKISFVNDAAVAEEGFLELPIRSTGFSSAVAAYKTGGPKPPSRQMVVYPDSPVGREVYKMRPNDPPRSVKMDDLSDPDYKAEMERHQEELLLETIHAGLDMVFYDDDGNVLESREARIAYLKGLGLTIFQFNQINEDITALTQVSDADRLSFFDESSGSGNRRTSPPAS